MKKKLKQYIKNLQSIFRKTEVSILPANLAFFFLMSVIPIISLTFFLCVRFNVSVDIISNFVENTFNLNIVDMLNPLFLSGGITLSSLFFIVFSFFIASNGADAIIVASNDVFNIENKPYLIRRLKALFITIILIILFAFIIFVPLLGNQIINLIHNSGIKSIITYSFNILFPVLKIPLSILVTFFLIKLIYKIAPDEKIQAKSVNKGALFTSVFWIISTYIYSLYINNVSYAYSIYYGSLTNIVIVLLWLYLLATIFVLGLIMNHRLINKEIEETNSFKFKEFKEKMDKKEKDKLIKK